MKDQEIPTTTALAHEAAAEGKLPKNVVTVGQSRTVHYELERQPAPSIYVDVSYGVDGSDDAEIYGSHFHSGASSIVVPMEELINLIGMLHLARKDWLEEIDKRDVAETS